MLKLFICGWRPWTVAGRYKSLMLNAKRLGHDVLGVAARHLDRQDLTMDMFKQLGIPASFGPAGEEHTWTVLEKFQPDVTFGEQYWNCPEEVAAREWARAKGKKHLVLDHCKNYGSTAGEIINRHREALPRMVLMTATEKAAEIARDFTKARIVVTGQPQYDLLQDVRWTAQVREKLGVAPGQKLIALSMSADYNQDGRLPRGETEWLPLLLAHAAKHQWKIVCSPHPEERLRRNQLISDGRPRLRGCGRAAYLRGIQSQGVAFVSDFVPDVAGGVRFEQVPLYELLAAADGVTGSSISFAFPCYAVGKKYFPFDLGHASSASEMPNVGLLDSEFVEFTQAVEQGSPWEQDEQTTRRFFYKLDGLCWQRILKEVV